MPHRFLCDVLKEMRDCWKTRNFANLKALIEEAQWMGNRMEAALGENKSYRYWHEEAKKEQAEAERLLKISNEARKNAGEEEKKLERYWD